MSDNNGLGLKLTQNEIEAICRKLENDSKERHGHRETIETEIAAAIAADREECIQDCLAEATCEGTADRIVERIRARGEAKGGEP